MHIAQVVSIQLTGGSSSELRYDAYRETEAWLKQWTPRANFKAVIGSDLEECLAMLREDLRKDLVPHFLAHNGVKPQHFKFQIADQAVENGRFWMPSALVRGCDFYLKD